MLSYNSIHALDCLCGVGQLPDRSVQSCITSPPYYLQRDYGIEGQYGMEETPELYVDKLVLLFREVRRALADDGVLWLNLGDGYWGSGKAGNNPDYQQRHTEFGRPSKEKSRFGKPTSGKHPSIKAKDLIGIPWAVAFALRNDGWYLRQEIIWSKPNGMPSSVRDRCTRNHEFIFMLSKSSRYYYDADAIKTPVKETSKARMNRAIGEAHKYADGTPGVGKQTICGKRDGKQADHGRRHAGFNERWKEQQQNEELPQMANCRSVWVISPRGIKQKHFAAFPLEIPERCVLASTRPGNLVLDPFMGAGTTAIAAAQHGRSYIGFELNPAYIQIANERLNDHLGLFSPSSPIC